MYRIAATSDITTCFDLHRIVLPGDKLPGGTQQWWLAKDTAGIAVAFASAELIPKERAVFMSRAGVLADHHGQGLQRRLLQVRERWARANAAVIAITYTSICNAPSANSLISAGYKMHTPEWAWVGREGVNYWIKHL